MFGNLIKTFENEILTVSVFVSFYPVSFSVYPLFRCNQLQQPYTIHLPFSETIDFIFMLWKA